MQITTLILIKSTTVIVLYYYLKYFSSDFQVFYNCEGKNKSDAHSLPQTPAE